MKERWNIRPASSLAGMKSTPMTWPTPANLSRRHGRHSLMVWPFSMIVGGNYWGRLRKRKIKHAKPVAAAVAA